jgi:hypothetical protein
MKATFTGKIAAIAPIQRTDGAYVQITTTGMEGKLEGVPHDAKKIETTLQLFVKPLAAEGLAYGDEITVELSTSRPNR